jgi:hypothetical protein
MRIQRVGLVVVAGIKQPNPGRPLRRHIDDLFAGFHQSREPTGVWAGIA